MPNTISVSPAHTDKVVVNGVDLLNRTELSQSQNRELQRYIDENAHLLGFLDKDKEAKEAKEPPHNNYTGSGIGNYAKNSYDSYSLDTPRHTSGAGNYEHDGRGTQSLGRANSPAGSDISGKRKGVSWSDGVDKANEAQRARSHSPKRDSGNTANGANPHANSNNNPNNSSNNNGNNTNYHPNSRLYSPAYSTSDKRRTPYDYGANDSQQGAESPWGDTWSRASKDSFGDNEAARWKGFPKNDIPAYSGLERSKDDYNRYDTHRYLEQQLRRSQDRDDSKKFYGFGDHTKSGVEIKPKRWTGGEVITDPNFIYKSLKPRRMFYSPIGDGTVAADGLELKRGPPDLTPRITVKHERIVEREPGRAGRRVYEHVWDEGDGRRGNGDGDGDFGPRYTPHDGDGGPGDGRGKKGPPFDDGRTGWPFDGGDGDGGKRKKPGDDDGGRGKPYGTGAFPNNNGDDDGDDGLGSRPNSALSIGTDGYPREGWTKTFITNPRELINQYANETPTNIFDINDHTPKTMTTVKETISEVVPVGTPDRH